MKVTFKSIGLFLIITTMGQFAFGQQLFKCDTAKSFWVFGKDNAYFAVQLSGKISEQERKNVIAVNNYALQYLIKDKKDYIKEDSITDLKVLVYHALSEGEYMSGLFKQKLNIQMEKAPLSSEKTVLIWFFEMPTSISQDVKYQVFANIIIEDKIIGLSSAQFAGQKLDDVKDFLMDVISTLRKVDSKDNFAKLCSQ